MQPEHVDHEGARLLGAVARLNRWATRHAELRIPPAQGRLLSLIDELGPARIGELANADHCSQPTMTTQVQRLEAAGWATRSADSNDARVALIELTGQGRAQLERLRAARAAALAPELARLSEQERQSLRSATEIILGIVHPGDDDQ
ncbi:MarR family transcriptional regulator [Flexivirga endophytica]|uniref:MarR family transcriptional regulator n=1 Tax=Flexivirga endophytica TaxID=1849103 RepID=A0A916WUW5_9MICO|nr:MarR family transcriptional regulator [Flexivirga endophytica]GGB31986.1 MarR family transcriptional regulator [Flexivirga endophytica]GHB52949.1 MarR family transcriptional regulator [Flexivirga endophytica]